MTTTDLTTTTVTGCAGISGRDWRSRAACLVVDPELFFPVAEAGPVLDAQVAAAKAVCRRCPVVAECLAEALARIPYGIAGGLTEEERRALARRPGRADSAAHRPTAARHVGAAERAGTAEAEGAGGMNETSPPGGSTVNTTLTPDSTAGRNRGRGARVVENTEFTAFGRRILRAAGRRVAAGDVDGLPALAALAAELDTAIADAVTGLRATGYSWGEIAARLGVTRQAAHQRWATSPAAPTDAGSSRPASAGSAASSADRGAA